MIVDCLPSQMQLLCYGRQPELFQYYQMRMRRHLYSCFEKNKLTLFPHKKIVFVDKVECYGKLSVFCVCRMPETPQETMIECSLRNEWYHHTCQSVPKADQQY